MLKRFAKRSITQPGVAITLGVGIGIIVSAIAAGSDDSDALVGWLFLGCLPIGVFWGTVLSTKNNGWVEYIEEGSDSPLGTYLLNASLCALIACLIGLLAMSAVGLMIAALTSFSFVPAISDSGAASVWALRVLLVSAFTLTSLIMNGFYQSDADV